MLLIVLLFGAMRGIEVNPERTPLSDHVTAHRSLAASAGLVELAGWRDGASV